MAEDEIKKLIKLRGSMRAGFTKRYDDLLVKLRNPEVQTDNIQAEFSVLETRYNSILNLDAQILDMMNDIATTKAEDLENELDTADGYNMKFNSLKIKINRLSEDAVSLNSSSTRSKTVEKVLKLPKLKLKSFNGELLDWLPFWSKFQRIHEDESLSSADKFDYLLQCISTKSKAYQLVSSYPPTAENYLKALDSLKTRYGRQDLLIDVYVRELLKLILNNAKRKVSLIDMFDNLESQLRSLESLGVKSDTCSAMLYPLVESCIPEEVLRVWQRTPNDNDDSTLDTKLRQLMKFLRKEVENEQHILLAKNSFSVKNNSIEKNEFMPTAVDLTNSNRTYKPVCVFCKKEHECSTCDEALRMTLERKNEILSRTGRCYTCLRKGHRTRFCRVRIQCRYCKGRHADVMCNKKESSETNQKPSNNKEEKPKEENSLTNSTTSTVLLQTLVVNIRNDDRQFKVRALIDTGSERSYICQKTAEAIGYDSLGEENLVHCLFGGVRSTPTKHKVFYVRLSNLEENYFCRFKVLEQPTITHSVPKIGKGFWVSELLKDGIKMHDNEGGPIELLIGADVAGKIFTGIKKTLISGLVAFETLLGWTVMGKIDEDTTQNESQAMMVTSLHSGSYAISDLWSLDVLGIRDPVEKKSREDIEAQIRKQFDETVKIDDNRYVVRLPWLADHPPLATNFELALTRTKNLMKKLKNETLFEAYEQVLNEWLSEGVIEKVADDDMFRGHYLPHRHVLKENSSSPLRPVFDASAKMKGAYSLNDCLERGINLIEIIPSLLIRFRFRQFGITADIKRAFLQISLAEEDRDFFKFLWIDKENKITVFRHARVVFGVVCSPYLLGAVIQHHLNKEMALIEEGSSNISKNTILSLINGFYVDNLLVSVDSKEDIVTLMEEATFIMSRAGFELRAWEHTYDDDTKMTSLLGLEWDRQRDTLQLSPSCFRDMEPDEVITKRTILSIAQKIYDPLGFCIPVTLRPKIMLQETWNQKLSWDEPVSEELKAKFLQWYNELSALKEFRVPRWITGPVEIDVKWSLHTFVDASARAYAAISFLRVESSQRISVQLVQAKNRVAPLLGLTIPRLELLAALIGARLASGIIGELKLTSMKRYFWSDSTTVLAWIRRDDQWGVFVRNRIEEIRKLTAIDEWHHVPGCENPADLPSRGCSVKHLVESRWWEGPSWLYESEDNWSFDQPIVDEREVVKERMKKVTASFHITTEEGFSSSFEDISSYWRIVRVIAWCKRFIQRTRRSTKIYSESLSLEELEESEQTLMKIIQSESFSGVEDDRIKTLIPFVDDQGLLRIKTKVSQREDTLTFRYPILLPVHRVARKMIMEQHVAHFHAGIQSLLTILRERYWVLGGRKTVRSIVNSCRTCMRFSSKTLNTPPVPLPLNRVRDARCFEVTGMDYAGPLYLRNGEKAYICLFTCAVYRAVHLELVTSMSTEVFLQAFRRFVNRRGRPNVVYSDNGTNFVGAENFLKKIDWSKVGDSTAKLKIKWLFIPPSAPWWGGWWERLVGLMKNILRRILGRASLSYEELNTVLTDCEAVLNARPLTYVSNDREDLVPLTPAMFLGEIEEHGVPDINAVDSHSLNRRIKYMQTLRDELRRRFRSEYLGALLMRPKKTEAKKIQKGDVVLVASDNTKRLNWPLGLVEELLPGVDGEVRLVRVRTNSGSLLRPIQRLLPLEVQSSEPDGQRAKKPDESTEDLQPAEPTTLPQQTRRGRTIKVPTRFLS